ncbi:MAG: hypothetical protein K1X79_03200 [Oligoflexia bacterium]|nr:hypothetical protein [Oligoflexia bacterium]
MSKSSKDKVIKVVKDTQALEIEMTEVDRNENTSIKRQKVAAFSRLIDEYLKSERGLILIGIQVK